MPYRQTEGIAQGHAKEKLPSILDFTTISRRINKLNIPINDNKCGSSKDDAGYLIIAIDSTGIKITNRGLWMRDKWNMKNKKGYLKIHIAVNIKTKKILSMKVTDEHVHDSKALPGLVNDIIKPDKKIGKLFADYNDIFRYLIHGHNSNYLLIYFTTA